MSSTSSRRLSRIGLATVTAISLTFGVSTPAFAGVNDTIGAEPRPGVSQEYADSTPALSWQIRDSFNDYTGGATHVLDGAEQKDDTFVWPYKSTEVDADGNTVVQYGGTVNYMKYCQDGTERGKCQLDLTVADPKIVFNPKEKTGTLYATVNSVQFANGEWIGVETVPFASLDFQSGRYNNTGKNTTWNNVAGNLLEAGNKTFSDFYTSDPHISSLKFTYPGETKVESSDEESNWSLEKNVSVDLQSQGAVHVYGMKDGSVLYLSSNDSTGNGVVLSHDLSEASDAFTFPNNKSADTAFDSATDTLYWVEQQEDKSQATIHMGTVTKDGLSDMSEVTTVDGLVTGFARADSNGSVGVLHLLPSPPEETDAFPAKFTTITADGVASTVDLPTPMDLYPKVDGEYHFNEIYGSYYPSSDGTGLRALSDGTFIFTYDHTVNQTDDTNPGALPLHITPAADDAKVELIEAFRPANSDGSHSFRGISTDGTNIAIYNDYANASVAFMKYEDGEFTLSHVETNGVSDGDLSSVSGVAFDKDGNALVASAKNLLATANPATGESLATVPLDGKMKGSEQGYPQGTILIGNDLYVMDSPGGTYTSDKGLQLLTKPTGSDGLIDSALEPVFMGENVDPEPTDPETSEPETSEPETSTPEPSEPETSTPETSTPETSTPEPTPTEDSDGSSSDGSSNGSSSTGILALISIAGILAIITGLFHFFTTQMHQR